LITRAECGKTSEGSRWSLVQEGWPCARWWFRSPMRRGDPQRIEVLPIVSSKRQAVTNLDKSAFTLSQPRHCVAFFSAAKTMLAADALFPTGQKTRRDSCLASPCLNVATALHGISRKTLESFCVILPMNVIYTLCHTTSGNTLGPDLQKKIS